MSNVIGVDIGGTRYRSGLFDSAGKRLRTLEGETLRSGGRDWMLSQVRDQCRALVKDSDAPVASCGISFGGPVDYERQRVRSMHVGGWEDFALADWMKNTLSLPARVDNDANCGALGEYRFGAGRGADSLAYVTLSTGIGGGLIIGGKVHRGKDSLAGEFGHLPVSDSDILCACGAWGCLETFSSGPAIARRALELAQRRPEEPGRIAELSRSTESITGKIVFQAAAEGDPAAVQIVNEAARWLARALLMVIHIVNPDKIILGGGLTASGNQLLDPILRFLKELSSPSIHYSTQVVLAKLGQFSSLHGAAALGLDLL